MHSVEGLDGQVVLLAHQEQLACIAMLSFLRYVGFVIFEGKGYANNSSVCENGILEVKRRCK